MEITATLIFLSCANENIFAVASGKFMKVSTVMHESFSYIPTKFYDKIRRIDRIILYYRNDDAIIAVHFNFRLFYVIAYTFEITAATLMKLSRVVYKWLGYKIIKFQGDILKIVKVMKKLLGGCFLFAQPVCNL